MKIWVILINLFVTMTSFGQVTTNIEPCKKVEIIKVEIETKKNGTKTYNQINNEIHLTNDYNRICFYLDSMTITKSNIYYKIVGLDNSWIDLKSNIKITYDIQDLKKGIYTFMIREYNCTGDIIINSIRLINKRD